MFETTGDVINTFAVRQAHVSMYISLWTSANFPENWSITIFDPSSARVTLSVKNIQLIHRLYHPELLSYISHSKIIGSNYRRRNLRCKVQHFWKNVDNWLQCCAGDFILANKPHSVILETSLTRQHGSKTGNIITPNDQVEGPDSFFFRMFLAMAERLKEEKNPIESDIWSMSKSQLFGEQVAYVAAFACGAHSMHF